MNTENIASTTSNYGSSRRLYKDEAKSLIGTQLTLLNGGLFQVLSRYQTNDAVRTWHETLRAIEEFINIPLFGISDPRLVAWLSSIRLDDLFQPDRMGVFHSVRKALSEHLEEGVVQRYLHLLMQTVAIAQAFKINLQPVLGRASPSTQ